jgi:hypothetical protein
MLRACMIDGFGWFPEHVFRRNWLLFDDVDYTFPLFVRGVSVPPKLFLNDEFRIVQPSLADDVIDPIVEAALVDSRDPDFRAYVTSVIPKRDAQCAGGVVHADSQIEQRRLLGQARDPAFAISFLAQKLVAYANSMGAVPIVGQDYAVNILARVLRRGSAGSTASDALVTPRRAAVVHAIAAGLSLRFVGDEVLENADPERLMVFKEKAAALRESHHAHLLKVARDYDGLPGDASFGELLADLRADAEAVRVQMDEQAKDLWFSVGLDVGGKALVGAASAAVAAIALIRADMFGAVAAALPGALTGAAMAAATIAQTMHKSLVARRSYLSYLTDASRYLATA